MHDDPEMTRPLAIESDAVEEDNDLFLLPRDDDDDDHVSPPPHDSTTTPSVLLPTWFRTSLRFKNKHSLACATTTPFLVSILIPFTVIFTHVAFYKGQTAPMWALVASSNVTATVNASSLEAKTAFYTLGIPETNVWNQPPQSWLIQEFTYSYAITELWHAAGMPSLFLPRLAAVLLVLFSGVWPHVKLVLLLLVWILATHTRKRQQWLHTLSALGKWSLADVLVVCLLLGVLQIDWMVDPEAIQDGIVQQLPLLLQLLQQIMTPNDICSQLLHRNCTSETSFFAKCTSCRNFVMTLEDHPTASQMTIQSIFHGVTSSGGGRMQLRVQGRYCMYWFCTAVMTSIILSLVIDLCHVRATKNNHAYQLAAAADQEEPPLRDNDDDDIVVDDDHETLMEDPEIVVVGSTSSQQQQQRQRHRTLSATAVSTTTSINSIRTVRIQKYQYWIWLAVSIFTAILVFVALTSPTMHRHVTGAGPKLLHDVLGMEWDTDFSLWTLTQATGDAGGWDWLLMGTFGLFLVLGPALRALLSVVAILVVKPSRFLVTCIDFVGAFCAWEVFVLAAYLVSLLIPSTTSTIVNRPECVQINPNDGSCLEVFFDMQDNFLMIVLGTFMVVVVAQLPSRLLKRRE